MTGERINSLILISAACLGVFLSKPYKTIYPLFYGFLAIGIIGVVWADLLDGHSRLVRFVIEIARSRDGLHFSVIAGGFEAFNTVPVFGIGPGDSDVSHLTSYPNAEGWTWTTNPTTILFKFSRRLVLQV